MAGSSSAGTASWATRHKAFVPVLAAAVALVAFVPSLRSGFVWDDHQTIVRPAERGLFAPAQVFLVFSRKYFLEFTEASYRPVVTLSYFLDFSLWGLSAFGFRLSNLLLHAAAAALVCAWSRRVTSRVGVSLGAALLFAVHPVQSEAVLNVSFREDILCVVFVLVALLCHARAMESARGGWNWRIASAVAYAVALFSKETALLVVPAVALLHEWTSKRRNVGLLAFHSALLLAVAMFYVLVRFGYMRMDIRGPVYSVGVSAQPFVARLMQAPVLVLSYVRLIAWPVGLHAERMLPPGRGGVEAWLVLVVLLIVVFTLLRRSKTRPAGSIGVLWAALALAPVLNLVVLPNPIAERYLYVPAVGLFLCMALWAHEILGNAVLNRWMRRTIPVGAGLVLALYVGRSVDHSLKCSDDRTLWQNTLMEDVRNAKARNNLGVYYYRQGQKHKAMAIYRRNVNLNPWNAVARRHLGSLYMECELYDKALQQFEAALQYAPSSPMLHYEVGRALVAVENLEGARSAFQAAIRLNPEFLSARTHLALVLHWLGEESLAQAEATLAARLARSAQERAEVRELFRRLAE